MRATIWLIAANFVAFSGSAVYGHDIYGEAAQQRGILAIPPAYQKIIKRHEELRDPDTQYRLVKQAVDAPLPSHTPAPSKPGELPKPRPSGPLQNILEQVADAQAFWDRGETLRICFLDGNVAARKKFISTAQEMTSYTDLHLETATPDCGSTGAQIHVSFTDDGYYSYVGNDALLFDESQRTLNLSGMGAQGNWSPTWVGIARHEIGHMLGMLHEHQHPDVDCGFKTDEEIAALLNWTLADVQTNFDKIKQRPTLVVTQYDPTSEMHYQLSASFFKNGDRSPCYIIDRNIVLSSADIEFLKKIYPK
ncbi:M12 family metallopeptidase [Mesorhizobium sp. WSM3626]|uniref:M12 family metallopeptidase n=1 Tax=Mesorhizobium sp. WSM3626 TaxID=1040987 RepID=UPI00047F59EC|nr:M12 family metallopeptidase [Mesorhizobium sp. WSM3626]